MSERTARKEGLRTIQVVLHWAWDPVGVRGIEEAVDEYDGYSLPILGMLEREASDQEIADYLTSVEVDYMNLKPHVDKNADIAAMLRELFVISRGDPSI